MGATKNFFREKKGWSLLKDNIFAHYLKPYIAKILHTYRPLHIYDCFAGKGIFDDGNKGSPIIIAENINEIIQRNPDYKRIIFGHFIENKYIEELSQSLEGYSNCEVIKGSYDKYIEKHLLNEENTDQNIFLYIDPYGIKCLDFDHFRKISGKGYPSLEILMNFNSFGFLREGFRLLKYDLSHFNEFDRDDETYEIDDKNSIYRMNSIAGGDYWQSILQKKNEGEISMFEAEEFFMDEYSKGIRSIFKHTVNIPIRIKTTRLPKYRLIFATNHPDGMILMADNMNKAWNQIVENQRKGQEVLFDIDVPDMKLMGDINIEEDILLHIRDNDQILLKDLIVLLIEKYGIHFSEKEYKNRFRDLEANEIISIIRDPELTPTGRKAKTLDYNDKRYKIYVRVKNG